jgi:GT2 family glycosyltransferase
MISVCVPVLRRYDLLRGMILSCLEGTVKPDNYYIIDNGRNERRLLEALGDFDITIKVHTPQQNLGVAASWNWFLRKVPEERIITNDDIIFGPDSIRQLIAAPYDLVWGSGFSCFVIRDSCVAKLGMFDETLSPGYGYYEDDDYLQRLDGRGTKPRNATAENVECGIVHLNSMTLDAASHEELLDHHRKFLIAQANYVKKWGLEEVFK